jgi:hypothetical protein
MSRSSTGSAPSWLTEENVSTAAAVANNPVAKSVALKAASNKDVQQKIQKAAKTPPPPPPPPSTAPAWATGSAPSNKAADEEEGGTSATSAGDSKIEEFVIEEETLKQMGKYHLALRVLYILAALSMSVAAAFSLNGQTNLGPIFFAVYVMLFCTLICCFECALSAVARILAINFGFMYTIYGRLAFILFVCFMSYTLGTWGLVTMCIMLAVMLYHFFVMYKFPRFEEYLRKKHYYEGRRDMAEQ